MNVNTPWVEFHSPENGSLQWDAEFACLVVVRAAKELEHLKWGFNTGSLLEDAITRQRLFLESQHYYPVESGDLIVDANRSLAMRCSCQPERETLQLALIAKVSGQNKTSVHQKAVEYWHEISSIFPFDYTLIPATTKDDFYSLAGWHLLEETKNEDDFAGIQRYAGVVQTGKTRFYLPGSWNFSKTANEQIWRVLAGSPKPLIWDVVIRPTVLKEEELYFVDQIAKQVEDIAKTTDIINVTPYAHYTAEKFKHWSRTLKRPFLIQARLIAPQGLPEYIARTIGFALTFNEQNEPLTPGFQITNPIDRNDVKRWCTQVKWLEVDLRPGRFANEALTRILKMVDAQCALNLFRFPFPPGKGIPGAMFTEAIGLP